MLLSKLLIPFTALFVIVVASQSLATPVAPASTARSEAERLVEQMRGFSMQPVAMGRSDGTIDPREQRREEIEDKLRQLGKESVPALVQALNDPDAQMRRNVELVMIALAGPYDAKTQVDIREALPALIKATADSDTVVRAWAAHAIAEIGPNAKDAVPALVKLLKDSDEGPRNTSCIALGRIGPAAKDALPALRKALNDPSKDVRRFAEIAIQKIEK